MNLTHPREEAVQYLVQMKLADSVRPKNPEDTIAFINQYVFPTLDVCDKLLEEKKTLPGGAAGRGHRPRSRGDSRIHPGA